MYYEWHPKNKKQLCRESYVHVCTCDEKIIKVCTAVHLHRLHSCMVLSSMSAREMILHHTIVSDFGVLIESMRHHCSLIWTREQAKKSLIMSQ